MPRNPNPKRDGRMPPRVGTWWAAWSGQEAPKHGQRRPLGREADRALQIILGRAVVAFIGTTAADLAVELGSTVQWTERILRHLQQCGCVIPDQPTRSRYLPTRYLGITEQLADVEKLIRDIANVDARTPRAGITALVATARRILSDAGPSRGCIPYVGNRSVPETRPVPLTRGRRVRPDAATRAAGRQASEILNSIRWWGRRRAAPSNGSADENAR